MDNRLHRRIAGPRRRYPSELLDVDLPEVARAITAVIQGRAKASVEVVRNLRYVRLQGVGVNTLVLKTHWEKIHPYFQDGTFSTAFYPVVKKATPLNVYDMSESVSSDPLYSRVFMILRGLFPTKVPTS